MIYGWQDLKFPSVLLSILLEIGRSLCYTLASRSFSCNYTLVRSTKMAAKTLTAQFESLPKLLKILIFLFAGIVTTGIYRIVRYLEKKNIVTLITGILCFFGIGFVMGIVDAVTEFLNNKVTVLAD